MYHIIQYYIIGIILYHLTTNTSIKQVLDRIIFFSNFDNGDLHLKLPLQFINIIVKSTMQAIIYKICDLFQKNKSHPASETYASDSAFKPARCISIIRRIIHASFMKLGPVITKI